MCALAMWHINARPHSRNHSAQSRWQVCSVDFIVRPRLDSQLRCHCESCSHHINRIYSRWMLLCGGWVASSSDTVSCRQAIHKSHCVCSKDICTYIMPATNDNFQCKFISWLAFDKFIIRWVYSILENSESVRYNSWRWEAKVISSNSKVSH